MNDTAKPQQKAGSSGPWKILAIVGLVAVLGLGCCVITAVISIKRTLVAAVKDAKKGIRKSINKSDLSQEQKAGLNKEVDRLFAGYDEGKVGFPQLGAMMKELGDGPMLPLTALWVGRVHVAAHAKLEKEEQDTLERAFQRYSRGMIDRSINKDNVQQVLQLIGEQKPGSDKWTFRKPLTREEALAFRDAMKQTADEAGVPDEEYEIDLAGELRKMVDKALGEASE